MDIRQEYLNFFKSKGHEVVASSPLVPNDETLLFTNAGMVPFKDIFTGKVPRPTPPIRTSCQTCIRAGGKHNDLDNVGYTARHHTFFEMLGNFSFGEYFKKEAISYAWEFVTEILKLPKERLYVTVHEKDDEAFEIWAKYIDKERIYRFGDKDNFWAMGDTGPCGPCSEIFYDQGSEHFNSDEDYMGGDGDRFLEIWNLVFMQFERDINGKMTPLPKPSIDTGMGLERVVAIKEGVFSNFDSSLFMPLIKEVEKLVNKPYEYKTGASYRVISDHIRSVTFLLAQGVNFDKEGRGYVLRRILRRAVRHGYLLGLKEPFMYKLVDKVCELMGEHYTYLNDKKEFVKELILLEEERFYTTIESGIELFNAELENTKSIFSGEVAFKLYDTYGFPLDLTADMLREKGLKVDEAKFDELMDEQRAKSKANWKGSGDTAKASGDFKNLLEKFGKNEFIGYENLESSSEILAILDENFTQISELKNGQTGWIMLDTTPFYATSGGQRGDSGTINNSKVITTDKFYELNLSKVKADENFKVGDVVKCIVSSDRAMTIRHHSATHLLHAALRKVLGTHVTQAGSSVEANRLRFDFSHPKAMSSDEILEVERLVNAEILKADSTKIEIMNINDAKKSGAMALFGEKYADNVRVLSFGDFSKELCGGTHVKNTAEIGVFMIVKESGVSAGVRRVEAICSLEVLKEARNLQNELSEIYTTLKTNSPLLAIEKLKNEIKELKETLKNASNSKALEISDINGVKVVVSKFDGDIKTKIDELKNSHQKVVALLINIKDEKINIAAGVKDANIKAGELVKAVAGILGGGGGGRDDFATAGGKDITKVDDAINFAKNFIKEKLS
ncbi:alanine--tRNA ligase [Campylobacter corcagiensis]|uniref:Alanine--tRNA ligase n=1 Tax=Campylobacter corcagiensis TaxID=1448857 RepID=A0A7M1LE27_9BACT|nr:alanine--tRNA ligase [Campylobacter corcagiensis]QKF65017.1 alanyl-tRNA synthetase [Campylobacter corcagiensis]QOQ86829.1 alanine--tRNA ligase [Campylobacter corcagiensis]